MKRLMNRPFLTHGDRGHLCLFLHGLGGGIYELQPLAECLQSQGYSTCGILYPGHDRPTSKMPDSCWQDWFAHVEETYLSLAGHYQRISLIGFSTGCILALKLVLSTQCDRLNSLVLMAPYMRIKRFPFLPPLEMLVYSLGYVINDLPRRSFPICDREMKQAAEEAAFFQTFNMSAVRSADELIQNVTAQLHQVTLPTLIFQSKRDSVVDPPGAEILLEMLGSSHKELEWLTQSDHIIPLDVDREAVFQRILDYLNSLETRCDRDR